VGLFFNAMTVFGLFYVSLATEISACAPRRLRAADEWVISANNRLAGVS